jgi:sortase A
MLTPTPPAPDPPRLAPTRLLIPAINLEAPIIAVGRETLEVNGQTATTWAVPRSFAAGWHQTSAPPGQAGNTVLNGHQNIYGSVFKNLGVLEAGDEIIIYVADTAYRYRVAEKHVLEEEGQPLQVRVANARWIMPTDDERLTLVTCAPDSERTQRLIVVAWPASE